MKFGSVFINIHTKNYLFALIPISFITLISILIKSYPLSMLIYITMKYYLIIISKSQNIFTYYISYITLKIQYSVILRLKFYKET